MAAAGGENCTNVTTQGTAHPSRLPEPAAEYRAGPRRATAHGPQPRGRFARFAVTKAAKLTLAALSGVLGTGDQADDVGTADGMSPLDIVCTNSLSI